ncbi:MULTISPECIES: CPBP family intramembrane glutamic endopeptidase [Methanobrevibacter]|uniref:CPBP family intramembrane glutamic endopeptidase n=1 Tax=Methanobrevibacter TaxID=2172 RepID=UPI0037DC01CA
MFSILLALIFVVIFGFGAVTIALIFILPPEILSLPAMDYVLSSVNNLVAFVVLIIIAKKIGLFDDIPWNVKGVFKGLLLGIPVLLFCLVQLSGILESTYDYSIVINVFGVVAALIYCVAIALWEEFLCRGVILTNMLKKWGNSKNGIIKSVILSAFIFGAAHVITGFGGDWTNTTIQIVYASFMGLLFGVIYIKTKSLASTIVLHFILNLTAYTMPYVMPNFQSMNPLTFILSIFAFVCLWVIETYVLIDDITKKLP